LRDRDLVRLYWPAELRPAFDALFDIDEAMADVVARSTQPALAAIKLAWWRERLQELDDGKIPAEPRLKAAAAELLPRGISGAELAELEDGWVALIEETPDPERALNRGATLFGLTARLIGSDPPDVLASAGRLYAAGTLQRLGLARVGTWEVTPSRPVPVGLRRLTGLAVLAKRDLHRPEAEGTPGRAWALLRHRLTGRIPQ
jgi:15-cis-phytoene synthase